MVTTFRNADIGIGVVLVALETLFIWLWSKNMGHWGRLAVTHCSGEVR